MKFCECGCGQPAPIAAVTHRKCGRTKGEPCRFIFGHSLRLRPRKSLADRFWSYIDKNGPVPIHRPELGPCWLWIGPKRNSEGRGALRVKGIKIFASRIAWFLHTGVWSELCICHKCDNLACARYDHLFEGTHLDNMRDMREKGRATQGERSGMAKLTDVLVREIRHRVATENLSNRQAGQEYGVDPMTIKAVVDRRTWRHVQ